MEGCGVVPDASVFVEGGLPGKEGGKYAKRAFFFGAGVGATGATFGGKNPLNPPTAGLKTGAVITDNGDGAMPTRFGI